MLMCLISFPNVIILYMILYWSLFLSLIFPGCYNVYFGSTLPSFGRNMLFKSSS